MRKLDSKDRIYGWKSAHSIDDVLIVDENNPYPTIPDGILLDEVLFEDTRQQEGKHETKHEAFARAGLVTIQHPLLFGDYARHGSHYVVDTKRDVKELCKTVVQEKWRNKKIFERATLSGYSLIILCENTEGITCTDDLKNWHNPQCYGNDRQRACPFYEGMMCDPADKSNPCYRYPHLNNNQHPADGNRVIKGIREMECQFSVYFFYCTPEQSAGIIIDFLSRP